MGGMACDETGAILALFPKRSSRETIVNLYGEGCMPQTASCCLGCKSKFGDQI
jgi:hypothetical protein